MFDIKWIRENPDDFDKAMARRGLGPQAQALIELDARRRELQTKAQEIQSERKTANTAIGVAKSKGEDASALLEEVSKTKSAEAEAEKASG